MTDTATLSGVYYRVQAATAAAVEAQITRLWAQLDLQDIDGSWRQIRSRVVQAVLAGQLRAAGAPQVFVEAVLAEHGLLSQAEGRVAPLSFAGWTAAGLPIEDVVDIAPIRVKTAIASGSPIQQARSSGRAVLTLIAVSETQDAGRGAMEASMRLEPEIVGYERHVHLPSCSRCVILAGRLYRFSTGFLRHPRCDCTHIPVTRNEHRDEHLDQTPSALFRSMSPEQQDATFSAAGAKAIREGADLSQVANARRGMSRPGDSYTTEGTTKRGRHGRPGRLSPQGIARIAGDDHARYIDLLELNGYLR